ncbi:hypothetical protein EYR41_011701 [Orbilia oligospora]|uniref:Uncharacterized protein n=1 Tax=Orbilia oligospora TaxID=2813651 RepID=A0A7C8PPV4_ORBOL|nr:hypothetical protein TWF751_006827 [Orbilia oligospora]TGJ63811.1 hypothetical protein EYR41_011701 [Orbilia oligospora]
MSANKTLKLLNSITSTTSASHRRRRSSVAVTAAASTLAPMFQSTVPAPVPPNYFPHSNQTHSGHSHHPHPHHGGGGGVNATAYQQFLPVFVTPTTPASSDLHTSYHGTNVTSPPPYYFHTPPISSVGGAGGAAIVGNGKNQQQQQEQQEQQPPQVQNQNQYQYQQQLFQSGPQAGVNHGANHSLHHTRAGSLHQDLLNKKHASRPSISQFSVANSSHFQFAFEAQPPSPHDSVHHSSVHTTNGNINNTPAVAQTIHSKRSAHSRQSSLNQVQTVVQPQPQIQQQQQQQVVGNSGFSFLCLNPEPIQVTAPQPVVQNQLLTPTTQGFLPGGFFSLTPEDSYPPLCTTFAQPATTPRENHVNSYFPIMPVNPVVQQIAPRTGYHRQTYQRLTKHAISAVDSRDSREFRWNRVLRYVHEISAPHGSKFPPSDAWILQQRQRVLLTPRQGSKGDAHSLWDGGSLGTNGVDDFIWDDDIQNGKRFTIPPKSQQGDDAPFEEDHMVFTLEAAKADSDLAFGYEVDDTNFCPPAKRTKSNESQKAARRGLHEYLAALKSFELSHAQDMKREAPLTMA